MNLSISNIAFKNENYEDYLEYLLKKNILNIEIAPYKHFNTWYPDTENILKLKKYFNVVSMQGLFYNTNINLFQESNKFIDHFNKIKKICMKLDCNYVVFGSPAARKVTNEKNTYEIFNEIFCKIQDEKIKIGIELNPKEYNCNFFNRIEDISKINFNNNIYFHYDLGCILMSGADPESTFINNKNIIKNIHISEKNLNFLINSNFNHKKFYIFLNKNNFKGNISLEMKECDIETFIDSVNIFYDIYGG